MSEFALRFATDELERANREAEAKRLAWLVARVAHPSTVDVDAAIEYADAASAAAEALTRWEGAQAEAQAEWYAALRRGGDEQRSGGRSPLLVGESPDGVPSFPPPPPASFNSGAGAAPRITPSRED